MTNGPPAPAASPLTSVTGDLAQHYLRGSLHFAARQPADLPVLAPRALVWYRGLTEVGLALPFAAVLDLGFLLLDGEEFRFRSFFADAGLNPAERGLREAYEARFLVRRLQEGNFGRLRRVLRDNLTVDLAVTRALEILLRPASAALAPRFLIEDLPATLSLTNTAPAEAVEAFDQAVGQRGALADQFAQLAAAGADLDLDALLAEEDFYELRHIRIFPRESLREVARRIKTVERLLGPTLRGHSRSLRSRAAVETSLESIGTYPTGGIAELTTAGPIENMLASELVYLEPDQPIDPFLVRFAEGEILKYLRDSAMLRMLRRSVVYLLDESLDFLVPLLAPGPLRGTKVIRCLLGLTLTVTSDLLTVFRRDDIEFDLRLLAEPDSAHEPRAERREIAEVVHLLLREREEQGTITVTSQEATLPAAYSALTAPTARQMTVVALATAARLAPLLTRRDAGDSRLVPVAVVVDEAPPPPGAIVLDLRDDPLPALAAARGVILERVVTS